VVVCELYFFSSRRRHTRFSRDWSSDVCSSDLALAFRGLGLAKALGEHLLDLSIYRHGQAVGSDQLEEALGLGSMAGLVGTDLNAQQRKGKGAAERGNTKHVH